MKFARFVLLCALIAASLAVSLAAPTPAQAQGDQPWLRVWTLYDQEQSITTVEYRDAAGTVLASYVMSSSPATNQAGGRIFMYGMEAIPIFDPTAGVINYYPIPDFPDNTQETSFNISGITPSADGSAYAYGTSTGPAAMEGDFTNRIYVANPGMNNDQVLLEETSDPWMMLSPIAWSADGRQLMFYYQPMGIGGYILFWQYEDVKVYDMATGAITPVGAVDGYSADFNLIAMLTRGEGGPNALQVTNRSTGQVTSYPLPALPEQPLVGGDAYFSPSGSKVAYQVARSNPEQEKYWTILVDLATGQSSVVLEDEGINYEMRYGHIGGWLDDNTLLVGDAWSGHTAVIDAASGTALREEVGAFIGYAVGRTDAAGFAPSGQVYDQCPGAPLSRLMVGQRGRVTFTDGRPVNVRMDPGGELVGSMPEGAEFNIWHGPICRDGYAWWYVEFDDGASGYVAEGDADGYYLEPW
ncbi:MAG: hypothetical protein JXJ20_10105 [Anaerolineae bacterium]|nr:hypothetical protein [Anaerolineae bacterium]